MKKLLLFFSIAIFGFSTFAQTDITPLWDGFARDKAADNETYFYQNGYSDYVKIRQDKDDDGGEIRPTVLVFDMSTVPADANEAELKLYYVNTELYGGSPVPLEANNFVVYAKEYTLDDATTPTWNNLDLGTSYGDSVAALTVTDDDKEKWVTAKSPELWTKVSEAKTAGKKLCLIVKYGSNVVTSQGYSAVFHNSGNTNPPTLTVTKGTGTVTASATIGGSTNYISGETVNITVSIANGTGPYVVTYNDGGDDQTFNSSDASFNIPVTPTGTITYTVTKVTDNGTDADINGTGQVTFTEVARSFSYSVMSKVIEVGSSFEFNFNANAVFPLEITFENGDVVNATESPVMLTPDDHTTYKVTSVKDDTDAVISADNISGEEFSLILNKDGATTKTTTLDTYIESGDSKDSEFLTETSLIVKNSSEGNGEDITGNRVALLKFDISDVTAQQTKILLGVMVTRNNNGAQVLKVNGVPDDISSPITYVNSQGYLTSTTTAATAYLKNMVWEKTQKDTLLFDVTTYINEQIQAGKTFASLMVFSDSTDQYLEIASFENTDGDVAPFLWFDANPPTAIDDVLSAEVTLYPNPASSVVYLSKAANEVRVYNISGQMVKSKIGRVESINVDDLQKGLYLFKLSSEKGIAVQKLFIE